MPAPQPSDSQLPDLLARLAGQREGFWTARLAQRVQQAVARAAMSSLDVERQHAACVDEGLERIDELTAFAEAAFASGELSIGEPQATERDFRLASTTACGSVLTKLRALDGSDRGLLGRVDPQRSINKIESQIAKRAAEVGLVAARRKHELSMDQLSRAASNAQIRAGDHAKRAATWQIVAAVIGGISLLVALIEKAWPLVAAALHRSAP